MPGSIRRAGPYLTRCSEAALNLLYPPSCRLCLKPGSRPICDECRGNVLHLPYGSCTRCGLGAAGACRACEWMASLNWIRSASDYKGSAGKAVRLLKFSRHIALADQMGSAMASSADCAPSVDFVVPVPIHWSRRAYRGFNQAELLARHIKISPMRRDILRRTKPTPPQARLRTRERIRQLQDAFSSKPCHGAKILLVDDVVTSGGTLEACADALKTSGASWVGAVTYCNELDRRTRRAIYPFGSKIP